MNDRVSGPKRSLTATGWIFAAIVGAFCLWILSLPLFPTQDGPMHRYYVHVLRHVLDGAPGYEMYMIRHPLPPYLTHYAALLLLSRAVPYDLAEKLFTCGLVVLFAYGFRFCATALGRFGGTVSLCIAPLFLQWSVMMGFLNYSLALGLFLFAMGFWARAVEGRPAMWLGYAAAVALLTFTHPVPLLVLICLGAVDLALSLARGPDLNLRRGLPRLAALAFACLAFLFVASSVDRTQSSSTLADFGFHKPFVTTVALLTGVSPYNTRALSPLVNLYRLGLYMLLAGASVLAARRFRIAWQRRSLTLADSFFAATVILALLLPFTPEHVNNSAYFATRLVVLVWIGALLAASGFEPSDARFERALIPAGLALAAVSLLTAEVYIRPVARTVSAIEHQALPRGKTGLLLLGPGLDNQARYQTQLAPDPFAWATVLPFVVHDDVALDSPWLDQKIMPVEGKPGSPLLIDDIRLVHLSKTDPPAAPSRSLPARKEARIVGATDFVVFAGTPEELAAGLAGQFDPEEAAKFHCSAHGWYLVCLAGAGL